MSTSSRRIHFITIAAAAGVFVTDYFTPLGFAVWILYLVPIILTVFLDRPAQPVVAATATTVLITIGYFVSPSGVEVLFAVLNRCLGVITIWTVAAIVRYSIRNRMAVQKEAWLQSGQSALSAKMSGEQGPGELAMNILRYLAGHTGANGGALFLKSGDRLKRGALVGVARPSSVPEHFGAGEGLLGQAERERRPFLVRNVPDGYLEVGSALGRSLPASLVIAPFVVDGSVKGVVELGYFGPVRDGTLEFLERVSSSVGVAIRSAEYRVKLQELLDETQRQKEQLQTQTEELRVSNEEIEEQSRALKESHSRLEAQQAELEQTNAQLESQAEMLESQKETLERSQAALTAQAVELQRASDYKSKFLANMSHELRTPLNSALILAKLLAENRTGNLTPEQIRYAETIHSAGNDLLQLINDVLDLSKVEAGRLELRLSDVPVSDIANGLRQTFQPLASDKGLSLSIVVGPGVPAIVRTDGQRLEQVLRNLLSNAVKFTQTGGVSLAVGTGDGVVSFAIKDTGIGIAQEHQEFIFQPFRQAPGSGKNQPLGTGLGLSISGQLAKLLGGRIQVQSEPGRGSTFTLLIPLVPPAVAPANPAPLPIAPAAKETPPVKPTVASASLPAPATGTERQLLVIEDDPAFTKIIRDIAAEFGFTTLVAGNAREGLELATTHAPHGIVLDIGLPDVTGLSVLDRLKKDPRTRHIPVHVVSGNDYTEIAFPLGAAGYVLKPVKHEQLVNALDDMERRFSQKIRRVLVVEDNAVQLESVRKLLEAPGVETVAARSARECLDKLRAETFDCMVLDLNLPDGSGFSLLETLSAEAAYSFPPVIVYTGTDLSASDEEKLRRYAKSVILKGAKSPERLLDEVNLFIHQVISTMSVEQQALLRKARVRDASLEGRHVLIVEDDVRNIYALTSVLEAQGLRLTVARNGREALAALERTAAAPAGPIDLVLMDVMMPEMDGLTATREIRKRPEWKKMPVIVLTAKATKNDQAESLEAGASDYISKPLDVDKLLSLIRVWMPR